MVSNATIWLFRVLERIHEGRSSRKKEEFFEWMPRGNLELLVDQPMDITNNDTYIKRRTVSKDMICISGDSAVAKYY